MGIEMAPPWNRTLRRYPALPHRHLKHSQWDAECLALNLPLIPQPLETRKDGVELVVKKRIHYTSPPIDLDGAAEIADNMKT